MFPSCQTILFAYLSFVLFAFASFPSPHFQCQLLEGRDLVCLLCPPLYAQHLKQSLVTQFYEIGSSIAPSLQMRKTKAKRGEVRSGVQNVRCCDHVRV